MNKFRKIGGFSKLAAAKAKLRPSNEFESVAHFLAKYFSFNMSQNNLIEFISENDKNLSFSGLIKFLESQKINLRSEQLNLENIKDYQLPALAFDSSRNPIIFLKSNNKQDTFLIFAPNTSSSTFEIKKSEILSEIQNKFFLLKSSRASEDLNDAFNNTASDFSLRSLIAGQKWLVIQILMAAIFSNLLGLTTSIYTMVVYDRILPNAAYESLFAVTIGVGIALLFDFLLKNIRSRFIEHISLDVDMRMGQKIIARLAKVSFNKLDFKSGQISNLFRQFDTLKDFLTSATIVALVDLPFVFLYIWVIYLIGGNLFIVPAVVAGLAFLIAFAAHISVSINRSSSAKHGLQKSQTILEMAAGLETIKASNIISTFKQRYSNSIQVYSHSKKKSRGSVQLASQALQFLQQSAQVGIIFYGVYLVQSGDLTMGGLIASVILLGKVIAPVSQVAQTLMRLNSAIEAKNTIADFLTKTHLADRVKISRPVLRGNFSFRNVSLEFGHDKAPVIDALTLEIIPGEKICVVGSNGSGKSTFMKLLTGLYSPSKGSVYLDNTDMENLDNSDFAANVGVVYQDPWLFSGTIRQNLLAKKPYASQEEIDFALDASCARLVIERLENGLDFQVGENGKGLSHGEKQVICIARAMVGHPSVLLFDEPTSALDGKTEQMLADNLRIHFSKATCIFITHRPAIGKFSDRILHLEKGQLLADTTSEVFFSRQKSKL